MTEAIEQSAQICERLATYMEQGAGEDGPGFRLRQAAEMIRALAAVEAAKPAPEAVEPLRAALLLAREYVEDASTQGYDGTQGTSIRAEAKRRLAIIDDALSHSAPETVPDPSGGNRWPQTDLGATDEDALAIHRAALKGPSAIGGDE